MAMVTTELVRVFKYNSVDLPDPGPDLSAEDVRELYSATYPEILNATIEGPEQSGGQLVYTFKRAVGTKGLHLHARSPVRMPQRYWAEIEKLSKAALMDVAWDYAVSVVGEDQGDEPVMEHLRGIARIITGLRKA